MDRLLVASVVVVAIAFLARRVLASWRRARAERDGCGSSCGCAPSAARKPADWDTLR
jgi:hypothetical protein